jgi:cytochrome P450 family 142 subfamily A polypeptide 1
MTDPVADRPRIALLDGAFYAADPHPAYAWMRRHGPVYRDPTSGFWGVAGYDAVVAAETDPSLFSSAGGARPGLGPLPYMIDMDDPSHGQHRRLVSRGFTPRRVAGREPRIRRICDALIDRICTAGEGDVVRDLAAPLPLIVIGDLLGARPVDRDDLLRWSDTMVASQSATDTTADALAAAAMTAFGEYCAYARRIIADRREHPADDLYSVLATAEIDGERLDEDALVHEMLLILVGGDETTRHVIAGGVEQLLRQPPLWAKLRSDPTRIPRAVEEMLRWVSPVKTMARQVTRDTSFFGADLKAGEELILLYESANYDETHFPAPFRFDIERTPNDHLAFGVGTHFCLGASLARMEIRVLVEQLVTRLPDLQLAGPEPLPKRANSFASGVEQVPVRFTPTAPLGIELDAADDSSWSWRGAAAR